jgi:hypothetical protein
MTVGFISPALRRGSPTDLTVRADRATLSDAAVEFAAADKALLKTASDPAFFTLAGKTVSIWVKLDDSADRRIFTQDENTLRYDPNEDAFIWDYNGFEDSYQTADALSLSHVDLTDWVHIVIVARSAGVKIYLNGILDTNDDSEIPVTGGDGNLYQFGGPLNGVWFDGKFDSSAIWEREFTDAEVLQLYNDGDGFTYSQLPANLSTGILHAWDFSARSSTGVWFDAVGGENLTEEFGDKVTNGDFAVDTGWTVGEWVIANGKAEYLPLLLDIHTGAAAAYSLQSISSQFRISPVVKVRRSGDDAEAEFNSAEIIDGTLTAWVIAGGGTEDGFVKDWYDQSGNNRHAVQATKANQPRIVAAGVLEVTPEGKPAVRFENSRLDRMPTTHTLSPAFSIFTLHLLTERVRTIIANGGATSMAANLWIYGETGAGPNANIIWRSTGTTDSVILTPLNQTALGEAFGDGLGGVQVGANGALGIKVTGHETTFVGNSVVGGVPQANDRCMNGLIGEIIIFPSDQTANRANIETDIAARYGLTI